jgi:hypothetical protein
MRGVNDKNFFNSWQILHRATCPAPNQTRWQVDDVEWQRERHSFFASVYSVSIDIHLLRRHARQSVSGWHLMVVIENWWGGSNDAIKTTNWARVLDGNPKSVVSWLRGQERIPGRAAV